MRVKVYHKGKHESNASADTSEPHTGTMRTVSIFGVFRAVYTTRVEAVMAILHTTEVITAHLVCTISNMKPVNLPR